MLQFCSCLDALCPLCSDPRRRAARSPSVRLVACRPECSPHIHVPHCLQVWMFSRPVKVGKPSQSVNSLRPKPPTSAVSAQAVKMWVAPQRHVNGDALGQDCSSALLFDFILISWLYLASPSICECMALCLKRYLTPYVVSGRMYASHQLLYYGLRSIFRGRCGGSLRCFQVWI